ncbi:MAG: hypothetical protein AUJ57_02175 [Zetaproteobacteria bacterium CG1_02_53_45]|nr:MAG: hypothetical protein AUJ57_02175 [Zetaproteobacteria bacterium CG1_02_53_45]
MRKRITGSDVEQPEQKQRMWLKLIGMVQAELTSEDEVYPIESALIEGGLGWRAAESGEQRIRLLFDQPKNVEYIRLIFHEEELQRTQEFVLRWSPDGGLSYHDIARQQYNFSSPDSTRELEDYSVDLHGVTALELCITPDISRGAARATLAEWRVA